MLVAKRFKLLGWGVAPVYVTCSYSNDCASVSTLSVPCENGVLCCAAELYRRWQYLLVYVW